MAAGDFLIRRNNSETTILPNAGANLDSTWDTEVVDQGGSISYSSGNFTLDTGIYLVMYSEKFDTTNTTNNERIEIQGEIHQSLVGVIGGYGQDYIRKSSGHQECIVSGGMILNVLLDNTDYFVRFYRTDDSTSGTVNRVPGTGGVHILQLDSSHNFGRYITTASEATSETTERTLGISLSLQEDTGFSRSGDIITISTAGRYFMTYSLDVSQTATGREDVIGFIERNSTTPVVGSYSYCYLRGADGAQDGALNWMGIVDVAANDTFRVRWSCPTRATITAAAGARFQIWQLPASADVAIMEATTGNWNTSGAFTYDTLSFIDTDSFTAISGTSNIDVDQSDYVLSFATFSQADPDAPQRAYPEVRFSVDGITSNYAGSGAYHRNTGQSGSAAATTSSILEIGSPNLSVEVQTTPVATTGTLNNDSAQFALVSLTSIFGAYTFPPSITSFNTNNSFQWEQSNLAISGAKFGSIQGTGSVEIWSDTVGTIAQSQTVDSWSDTSIQIDTVRGSLPNNTTVYIVVTSDSGFVSYPFAVNVGIPSYDSVVAGVNGGPDHYWTFNNTYVDTGINGPNDAVVTSGSPGFTTNPLTRDRTHSFTVSAQGQRIEPPNSNFMNGQTETVRSMGGWINVSEVQDSFICLYEEGGGVNNLAFFMGIGGILIAQLADTSDDNVHAYSDFKLEPNRNYYIMFRFDYNGTGVFELLVDGIVQSTTFGNPLGATDLDGHSGDIGWGDASGSLEVFGTDINFPAAVTSYYNDWHTWTSFVSNSDIRGELFEKGVRGDNLISGDTQANMQLAIDAFADTIQPNSDCTFVIEESNDGDFTLNFDNITFNDSTSIHVLYNGNSNLTIVNQNGSNTSISSAPYGGTVTFVEAVPISINCQDINTSVGVENARVYITAAAGGPLTIGTVIFNGLTDSSGNISSNLQYSSDQPISGRVRKGSSSPFYKSTTFSGTVNASGFTSTVFLIPDE